LSGRARPSAKRTLMPLMVRDHADDRTLNGRSFGRDLPPPMTRRSVGPCVARSQPRHTRPSADCRPGSRRDQARRLPDRRVTAPAFMPLLWGARGEQQRLDREGQASVARPWTQRGLHGGH
jgi:hypothetical protein